MLNKIPKELKGLIDRLRQQALAQGLKVYLVGGFVRDLILGVKNLDLDIVVEGDGIKFAGDFARPLHARVIAHKQFGTATVLLSSGLKIDFSSARKEAYPHPAHLPVVSPGTLKDDLFRRDFTINAMALSLARGELIDYFGGRDDLRGRRIRVLHDLSFQDDPTRVLRAVRFEQRYNFKLAPRTLRLLKEAVSLKLLARVHPHRMRDDLILLLKEKNPLRQIRRLKALTDFRFLHPKAAVLSKDRLLLKSLEKEIKWFNKNYPRRRNLDCWLIYLSGILDPLNLKQIEGVCRKFGLRRGEEIRLLSYKRFARRDIADLSDPKARPAKIFALLEPLSYETIISLRAKSGSPVFKRHVADFLEVYNGMRIFIRGEDLRGLGLSPGPKYKNIFTRVLEARLNGEVRNKAEELSLIKSLLKKRSY